MRGSRHILGILAFTSALGYATPKDRVIYGADNREDYYQVTDPLMKISANSTVALVRRVNLTTNGATTAIATVPYGPSFLLCEDEPFYEQQTAAFCSGFLVNFDTVVTAGHCISNQISCDNTKIVFGFKVKQADITPQSLPTDNIYSCKSVVHSVSIPTGEDFAVIKLDRRVTQALPLMYRVFGKIKVDEPLHVIGYPSGLPVKVAGGAKVRSVQPQFFVANLDTYGGNSGSPVFNSVSGAVEGVLVRGETDFVFRGNCRVSNRCPDTGCRGEDVTLMERILPYLVP